jgi:5-methyltetrahydrofolate--homocysteine methyltransferase
VLYRDTSLAEKVGQFHFLRQQKEKVSDTTFYSLADFIAPESSGKVDYIGGFAVTAGFEVESYAETFKKQHDDYRAIMVQALGDRFAEALAEYVHKKVRDNWGFGESEDLSIRDMIGEKYRGIRPAAGYPACPDHTEKAVLWDLLDAEAATGISLTESYAMNPPSSVSGLYLGKADARYFSVGKIGKDQIESYAGRKGISVSVAEKWLQPNLDY